MQAFEYCVPTRIVFGKDSVEKLPEQLKKSGASRVLVVYGGHSAKKSGLLDRVLALLGGAGVSYDTLGGVQDAAGVEDLAARVSYHGTRRVGTLVSLDHEALREIFEMANH